MKITMPLLLLLVAVGCGSKQVQELQAEAPVENPAPPPELPALLVKKFTTVKDVNTDTTYQVLDAYFEIALSSVTKDEGRHYIAVRDIERPRVGKPYRSVSIALIDSAEQILKFKDSTDFLNFMAARGYDMVSDKPNKFGSEYTFKKKTK